jgi:hypothetical protein
VSCIIEKCIKRKEKYDYEGFNEISIFTLEDIKYNLGQTFAAL